MKSWFSAELVDLLFRNLDVPGSILGANAGNPDLFIYLLCIVLRPYRQTPLVHDRLFPVLADLLFTALISDGILHVLPTTSLSKL
jgi:hypothetical protein